MGSLRYIFWFKKIVVELVKHPETRFQVIPKMIQEAYNELDRGSINYAEELKFTQRLKLHPYEYEDHVRTGIVAKSLDKDKGDLVYWYETYTQEYVKSKQCWKRKKSYSVKLENLNLDEYKNLLLNKLKDSLEIAGFSIAALERELFEPNTISDMAMPSRGVAGSMTSYTSFVSGANEVAKNKEKK